ncbi:MAG: hypothetical protein Q8O82_01380 [Pseudorhodobacter sp.]|nr:hypothetical protein [Pseudorhodobacter sp.]
MKMVADLSVTSAPMRARHGWHPGWMFRGGAQGAWYDPADPATLFQDSAGTVPVAAAGDPVGLMRDKSGNGNHATQVTAAARPVYRNGGERHWLEFNGVNQFLVTPTLTPGTDKAQVLIGLQKLANSSAGLLIEHSASLNTNPGTFYLFAPITSGAVRSYGASSKGTAQAIAFMAGNSIPSPSTNVVSMLCDIGADNLTVRADGSIVVQSVADQGTGNFLAYPAYIGMRGGIMQPFNGNIYSMILRFGPNLSAAEITRAEQYIATKTGVAL